MSSGISRKKYSISHKSIVADNFNPVKLSVPFTEICFKIPEKIIYDTIRSINFQDTALEFQKIMKKEFNDVVRDLEINKIKE